MSPLRAVLLDALGTLVELPAPWPALLEEMAYYRAHHDEATGRAELGDLRDRCTEVLRAALPAHARAAHDLRGALLGALRFRPYPEVPGVLAELGDMGIARVVVSNWDVSLREVLDRTGLTALLDGIVISAEVGAAKPDPAIFASALDVAGARPDEALHVGDTLDADVAGARAAGLRALHLDRSGADTDAMASLTGLPGFVRSTVP